MPDEMKFQTLRDVGYQIKPHCGLCKRGEFPSLHALWGRCTRHSYIHGKHNGDSRLGILRTGCCETGFTMDPVLKATLLQSYADLFVEANDAEALLDNANAFSLEPVFYTDPDCPENDCWGCKGPFLPDDAHIPEQTLQGALRAACRAITGEP